MALPRSVVASLVVAVVAYGLLQLESARLRRDQERAIVARLPLAEEVVVDIGAPGTYRLSIEGRRQGFSPLELSALTVGDGSRALLVHLEQDRRPQRVAQRLRQALAMVTFDSAGRYVVRIMTRPTPTSRRGATLLVARAQSALGRRGAALIAALTTVMVLAVLVAAIGAVRALREKLAG